MRNLYLYICISVLFASCRIRSGQGVANPRIDITVDEIRCTDSEFLNLKSYYLSCCLCCDRTSILYGYNYKDHGIDVFSLKGVQTGRIPFDREGESAVVPPVSGLYVHTSDSIWIYDASCRILLLDGQGKVKAAYPLLQHLHKGEEPLVQCNHAMSVARLYYDAEHESLLYGVKDLSSRPKRFHVCEWFLKQDSIREYAMRPSVVVPDLFEGDYANMSDPNIGFANGKVVYGYAAEPSIYLLDRVTGTTEVIEAASSLSANKAGRCSDRRDYSAWERHGMENPHFYDVMYLPASRQYVRLHLKEHSFDASVGIDRLMADRTLCLMCFDDSFHCVGETELVRHRYNYYTGWCAAADGILLYVDNLLDGQKDTDNLVMDKCVIHFPE